MTIEKVESEAQIKDFLNMVENIYADFPNYIRPLDKDIKAVFSTENPLYDSGKHCRWLVKSGGNVVGRIAAFVNPKHTSQFPNTGGIGFFESTKDFTVASLLLKTAKDWLSQFDIEQMDGPINFGERDKFWGMTLSNYEKQPYYQQNYTPPYYKQFFEKFGFQVFYKQLIYHRSVDTPLHSRFLASAQKLKDSGDYTVEKVSTANLKKYAEDFRTVYNLAWTKRDGQHFEPLTQEQAWSIIQMIKPILDSRLSFIAYHKGQAIGAYIALPDVNPIFKKFKGKFGIIQKLQFWYYLKTGYTKQALGLVFGVIPEFQNRGVESLLLQSSKMAFENQSQFTDVVITWIGDFNPKMIAILRLLGCELYQEMATYRYLFDPSKVFERHPIV